MLNKLCKSDVFFALVLFAFAIFFPPIDAGVDDNLAFHMAVQHILIFVTGLIIGTQLAKLAAPNKATSILLSIVAITLAVIWHLPEPWDAAVTNESTHILMHLSFFLGAALIALSVPALGSPLKWWLLVVYFVLNSILAAQLTGGRQMYQSSPAAQHSQLAIVMVYLTPLTFLLLAFAPYYMPVLTSFWTKRKLSLWVSGLLILVFLIDLVL